MRKKIYMCINICMCIRNYVLSWCKTIYASREHCSPVCHFKLAADLQSAVSTSASPLPFPVGSSNKMLQGKV